MNKEQIIETIKEHLYADHCGTLYGHNEAAEYIAIQFMQLESEIERLKERNTEMGWKLNPDRMGGQFTPEEINRGNEW